MGREADLAGARRLPYPAARKPLRNYHALSRPLGRGSWFRGGGCLMSGVEGALRLGWRVVTNQPPPFHPAPCTPAPLVVYCWTVEGWFRVPCGGVRPVDQKSTCLMHTTGSVFKVQGLAFGIQCTPGVGCVRVVHLGRCTCHAISGHCRGAGVTRGVGVTP